MEYRHTTRLALLGTLMLISAMVPVQAVSQSNVLLNGDFSSGCDLWSFQDISYPYGTGDYPYCHLDCSQGAASFDVYGMEGYGLLWQPVSLRAPTVTQPVTASFDYQYSLSSDASVVLKLDRGVPLNPAAPNIVAMMVEIGSGGYNRIVVEIHGTTVLQVSGVVPSTGTARLDLTPTQVTAFINGHVVGTASVPSGSDLSFDTFALMPSNTLRKLVREVCDNVYLSAAVVNGAALAWNVPESLGGSDDDFGQCIIGEADRAVTAGDNIALAFVLSNSSSGPAENCIVTFTGQGGSTLEPSVEFWDASTGHGYQGPTAIWQGTTAGRSESAVQVDAYIGRMDPDPRVFLPGLDFPRSAHFSVALDWTCGGNRQHLAKRVTLVLKKIQSTSVGSFGSLVASDCLRHPEDINIVRYAQFAAGDTVIHESYVHDSAAYPGDSAKEIAWHVTKQVEKDFKYGHIDFRTADIVLLQRRGGTVGVCEQYRDLMTGLLRSLGLPTRDVEGHFGVSHAHAWNEFYDGSSWVVADATPSMTFDNDFEYAQDFGNPLVVWASPVPLSEAGVITSPFCYPACNAGTELSDCVLCYLASTPWFTAGPGGVPSLCKIDERARYSGQTRVDKAAEVAAAGLQVSVVAPACVTVGEFYSATINLTNASSVALQGITVVLADRVYAKDPDPVRLFFMGGTWTIPRLDPGWTLPLTAPMILPLKAGIGVPLYVLAMCPTDTTSAMLQQNVQEGGSGSSRLVVTSLPGPAAVSAGQIVYPSATVTDECGHSLADASVFAWVYQPSHTESMRGSELTYLPDRGFYVGVAPTAPDDPLGLYQVEITASRSGCFSNTTYASFSLSGQLAAQIACSSSSVSASDSVELTARIDSQGSPSLAAQVVADIRAGDYTLRLPLTPDSVRRCYATTLVPGELASHTRGRVVPSGIWEVEASAQYYGAVASALTHITVSVPDLAVESADADFAHPYSRGDSLFVDVEATVANVGSAAARGVPVRFLLDAPDSTGTPIGPDRYLGLLEPGSTSPVSEALNVTRYPGNRPVWVVVDPDQRGAETDRTNNIALVAQPVGVAITEFEAMEQEDGAKLRWRVGSDNQGHFLVWRSVDGGARVRLTDQPIDASRDHGHPSEMSWLDRSAPGDGLVQYWLETTGERGIAGEINGPITLSRRPLKVVLAVPYPSPTQGSAVIEFTLDSDRTASVGIYDLSGRIVAGLASGKETRGVHRLTWDGRGRDGRPVAAGLYFVRLRLEGGRTSTRKLVVLR